jgi:DNA-binding GntR family transcriptional regulator
LAEELEVSRVPLREAVPWLAVDGFVETLPRRSAVVAVWSRKAANDLFDVRLCLEVGAAGFAARQVARGASAQPLHDALKRSRISVEGGDAFMIATESTRFHEVVVDLADNPLMRSAMRSLSGRMMWLFFLTSALDPLEALGGHRRVLDGIASGNQRLAESVAYAHIEQDRDESLAELEKRLAR